MKEKGIENNNKIDEKKLSEKMESLKIEKIEQIKTRMIESGETLPSEEELDKLVTVKCFENLEFVNEQGEIIDKKNVFVVMEQLSNGEMQISFYDEEQQLIAKEHTTMDGKKMIVSAEKYMWGKLPEEIEKCQLEKTKDIEQVREEEKIKAEETRKQEIKNLGENEKQKGPQLTLEQAAKLEGLKIPLSQPVDKDITLENKIGIRGEFLVLADINEVKKLIPDLEIAELGQKFVPIVIGKNGANVVSEDKMRFSTIKGSNSTELSISENNDGTRTLDQSIVTFEIPGTHNYISVGYNEGQMLDPYWEAKIQTVDRDSNRMGGEELLQSHIGTIEDPEQHNQRRNNTEGQLKYTTETVSNEQAERAAKKLGLWMHDKNGEVTGLDLDKARLYLLRESVGEKSVEEVIEHIDEDVKQIGDPTSNNPYME